MQLKNLCFSTLVIVEREIVGGKDCLIKAFHPKAESRVDAGLHSITRSAGNEVATLELQIAVAVQSRATI